ncbi:MAG TPA: hypothetical protein VF604_07080 [Pyrinomonadaceae bacterium]|jgi:hypothetical protein
MKLNVTLLLLLSVLSFTSCKSQNSTATENQNKNREATIEQTPVLVELFTSEG